MLLSVAVALAGDVADDVLGLPEAGSSPWDDEVRARMLAAYDSDGSGAIERTEVRAIPCDVWVALDRAIAEGGRYRGLLETYGFRGDLMWLGGALGFRRGTRSSAERAMRACGVTEGGPLGDVALAPDDTLPVGFLRALPHAGSDPWQELVRIVLVQVYDTGRSGLIDADEAAVIGCPVWRAADDALRRDTATGVVDRYGLRPDRAWRGFLLGLSADASDVVIGAMSTCEVPGAFVARPPPDASATAAAIGVIAALPEAGALPWDVAVFLQLTDTWDLDGSGLVDKPAEVAAMPCELLVALDDAVRAGGRYGGVVAPYGFGPDADGRVPLWLGNRLGFGVTVTTDVRDRFAACGVTARPAVTAAR